MKIADISFPDRAVFLAPMEDVTDVGFRLQCKEYGADMVYSEFVSADALIRSVESTERKLQILPAERPVAIQIYGRDVASMVEAARIVEQARPDIIDINCGCPVKRVAGKGAGAGLLRDVPLMLDIVSHVVQAVRVPVTVKTRLGWDCEHRDIVRLAEQLQDCGIAALAIHGRTRSQMYTGQADWSLIGEVKRNPRMTIPIIGNGDVTDAPTALRRFEECGVDAIMVGRATFGRPWIFREIRHLLDTGRELPPPGVAECVEALKRQVERSVARIDEYRGILHIRRHLAATPVFKGIPNFRDTRIALLRAETVDDLFALLDQAARMAEAAGR